MSSIGRTLAITVMFLKPNIRNPLWLVLVSVVPVSFVVVFHIIGGSDLGMHALIGMAVVFAINPGVVALPQISVAYRISHRQDMFVASPVGPGVYALGMGLSRFLLTAPAMVVVLLIIMSQQDLGIMFMLLFFSIIAITSFVGIMIGFAISALVPNIYKISFAANLVGYIFSVLPPVYYPLSMISDGWQVVAMVLPTTHAAQIIRVLSGLAESSGEMLALHWVVLSIWGALCGFFTFFKMSWREK